MMEGRILGKEVNFKKLLIGRHLRIHVQYPRMFVND